MATTAAPDGLVKRYIRWLAEAVYGVRTGVQVTFRYPLGHHVTWLNRPGVFVVVWRRYHEGQVGTHIIYGICKVGEEQWPGAQIWTALESDLQGAA